MNSKEAQGALPNPAPQSAIGDHLVRLARKIHGLRQMRAQAFGYNDLFAEPAWDILLDMFIAAREGKNIPISSVCIGSGVPTTTALRWINTLEARRMIIRDNDPADARRVFLRLSKATEVKLVQYLAIAYANITAETEASSSTPPPPHHGERGGV